MNTATQAAPHTADNRLDVQPLYVALAEMRESLAQTAPGSLELYNMFEPWVLAWAGNPKAMTSRAWLAGRWKCYIFWRVDEILTRMQAHYRTPRSAASLHLRDGFAQLRDLARAFGAHFSTKYPLLTMATRALGSLTFYVFLGALFLACQVIGLDLGDRLQAFWKG